MKTKYLLPLAAALIIFLAPSEVFGQFRAFVLGIKAAPSVSWLSTSQEDYNNEGSRIGFSWGVISEFYFAKNYALATGFNYIYHNGKISFPDLSPGNIPIDLERQYRLRYLEIPVQLKLKTNEIGKLKYYGQVGLGLGVRTTSKARDEYNEGTGRSVVVDFRDVDNHTRLFRAALIVGAGVEYPIDNSTVLIFGVNFNNGFTNALKKNNAVNPDLEHSARPNFLEIQMGVIF
jgi:hypothetical protein